MAETRGGQHVGGRVTSQGDEPGDEPEQAKAEGSFGGSDRGLEAQK